MALCPGVNMYYLKTSRKLEAKPEFLNLIIQDCECFERLQNVCYRSTHSCTNIKILAYFGLKN